MGCEPPAPPEFRQAVVVIHGIGEQRPMDTLRAFVTNAVGAHYRFLGKPDRISESLELYRLSAHKQGDIPRTDFYELYWAHLMEGTTWAHVAAWMRVLLVRSPKDVPPPLQPYWWGVWLLLAVAALVALILRPNPVSVVSVGILGYIVARIARAAAGTLGLHYVGDAARYLSPTPSNIRARHAIRTEALKLLRGLHDNPFHPTQHYDRIIVVGHSLGSVIAYDAVRYYWQEVHSYPGAMLPARDNEEPPDIDEDQPALAAMQETIGAAKAASKSGQLERLQALESEFPGRQQALWNEQRRIGIGWKITDLVTLGSPLTYADFLMADGHDDFERRHDDREFPTCPPQPEDDRDKGLLAKRVTLGDREVTLCVLHHAAPFACTRWTNLYYPSDLIGGRLKTQFGPFIQDCELPSPTSWPTSHVRYWQHAEEAALEKLTAALRLTDRGFQLPRR
jgi:hypothetical protein